jgi:hypothetical protein
VTSENGDLEELQHLFLISRELNVTFVNFPAEKSLEVMSGM